MITARIRYTSDPEKPFRVNLLNDLNEVFAFATFAVFTDAQDYARANGAEKLYWEE